MYFSNFSNIVSEQSNAILACIVDIKIGGPIEGYGNKAWKRVARWHPSKIMTKLDMDKNL